MIKFLLKLLVLGGLVFGVVASMPVSLFLNGTDYFKLVVNRLTLGLAPMSFEVDLSNEINPMTVQAVIDRLKAADYTDTVIIYINSPGGYVSSMVDLINAMSRSDAHVVTHVTFLAASAAANITMAGDEIIADPISVIMFHMPSSPNEQGIKTKVPLSNPVNILINGYSKDKVFKYLTVAELNAYMNGEDVYIPGNELINRIKADVKR